MIYRCPECGHTEELDPTDWREYPPACPVLALTVPGQPVPNARARSTGGRHYTPARTARAREQIRLAWMHHGKPRIDGDRTALVMDLEFVFARPPDHFRADGSLSAKGRREPYPHGHGDLDNLWKLACDALQDQDGMLFAFCDDAQVVEGKVAKRWARRAEVARTVVVLHGGYLREVA